jgi:4-hydroxy-tetrahydrodipicolinate synthase
MLDFAHLHGIVPPLVTPLNADETVDEPGLRRLVRYALKAGVHGVFALGSTGEFAALPDEERKKAAEIVVSEVAGAVPVFVGTGGAGTRLAIRQAQMAQQAKADALVVLLPYYYRTVSAEEQHRHFETVIKNSDLPVLLYNIPQLTKDVLSLEVVEMLRENPRVAGMKDSSEDFEYFQALMKMAGASFRLFQGSEALAGASLLMHAHGAVLGIANLAPGLCVNLYNAAKQENAEEVRRSQNILNELRRIYHVEGSTPIGSLKEALSMIGICQPYTTSPLARPSAAARARIEGEVKRFRDQF